MTAPDAAPGGQAGPVPVACALGSADLAAQYSRWEKLMARAMTGRAETADGLRLRFRREPGAEEQLRALAAVENECCPWAAWTVRADAGQILLDVRSAGAEGIAALHGMFTGRRSASPPDAGASRDPGT
jgi:hypothetical protein